MSSLTQSLQEKALKDFDEKFSDLGEFKWPEGSDYLNRLAVRHLEARKFISNLVAEVVEETEKRVREEVIKKIKRLGQVVSVKFEGEYSLGFLEEVISRLTQPKEEK